MTNDHVQVWAERLAIPTYKIGSPNKNPMFLERRVYQGSSGVVYPHAVVDQVFDEKHDREYTALFLENRYLEIMILPELGGRVQMALDKTNNYHFVYYNRVIKPALVGLAGPWISGGIEFNWPQHHRPTTFDPLDWRIVENPDGSATIWCAEIEPMFRTKGMHGFTLYPDRALLEITVKLYNRTDLSQTFLWWANPAVTVNDDYQTIFPPDVTAVMDHGKRDLSAFPVATGVYYKHDYAPGTDISRYGNIPVPTSYMAYHSDFDFLGGYDHGRHAGIMHVADHHIVPGKKQWTWGNGNFGEAWTRQLTDDDGPYIELMCGAFTDNQPDFSWIQPGEEKSFTQYFLPYKEIGAPQNASSEVLLHLSATGAGADIGVYSTRPRQVRVRLIQGETALYDDVHELSPEHVLRTNISLAEEVNADSFLLEAWAGDALLLSCAPRVQQAGELPLASTPAPEPQTIGSNEELFLHGLHLEQYRHATWAPEAYYREALRRDPRDSRCNNAFGLLHYRRGNFAEAEACFRNAVARLQLRNPNPYDGEAFYNLGLALRMQGRFVEATGAFYKCVWNHAWQAAGYFELARLANRASQTAKALEYLEHVLAVNGNHHKARHLKIALHRRRGELQAARQLIRVATQLDALEYGSQWEAHLLGESRKEIELRTQTNTLIELALDYAHAGLIQESLELLALDQSSAPMREYLRGWVYLQAGDVVAAMQSFLNGAAAPPDYCFPNRLEDLLALEAARRLNPGDARAPYYLGNFLYALRRHEDAITQWEAACALDDLFATAQRNLGLAYFNQRGAPQQALSCYERAFALDSSDARILFELDQLHKKMNLPPAERLQRMEAHRALVAQRDDLTVEYVTLLNLTGQLGLALEVLDGRSFHPWEGGEGKVSAQFVYCLTEKARFELQHGHFESAIELLGRALQRPLNLGEGKLEGTRDNNIHYYLGCAWRATGDEEKAAKHFALATEGTSSPVLSVAYYDQPPEMIFYQGVAWHAQGMREEAGACLQRLVDYGTQHADDDVKIDYFAVSLPEFAVFEEPIDLRHRIRCQYMIALGSLGLGDDAGATAAFDRVLALDASHQGAIQHRDWRPPLHKKGMG